MAAASLLATAAWAKEDARIRKRIVAGSTFMAAASTAAYASLALVLWSGARLVANAELTVTDASQLQASEYALVADPGGAAGVWQFMPSTGRQYMMVNDAVDERKDPLRATQPRAMARHEPSGRSDHDVEDLDGRVAGRRPDSRHRPRRSHRVEDRAAPRAPNPRGLRGLRARGSP